MKIETYEGEIQDNGAWGGAGLCIENFSIEDLFAGLVGKKVKITIEEIPEIPEQDDEPKISFKLKVLVKKDAACDELGLNPWCVAEGADGDSEIQIKLSQAKRWRLID